MTKDTRIEFYEDQEFQKIVSIFYGLVSAVAMISFHFWLQDGPDMKHLSGLSFVLIWATITIAQIVFHFRGYKITLLNGIIMIASLVTMLGVYAIWLAPYLSPYR